MAGRVVEVALAGEEGQRVGVVRGLRRVERDRDRAGVGVENELGRCALGQGVGGLGVREVVADVGHAVVVRVVVRGGPPQEPATGHHEQHPGDGAAITCRCRRLWPLACWRSHVGLVTSTSLGLALLLSGHRRTLLDPQEAHDGQPVRRVLTVRRTSVGKERRPWWQGDR